MPIPALAAQFPVQLHATGLEKAVEDDPETTHMGDLDEASGSYLGTATALAIVAIW